ncbi:LysR family transcriptional regulator [Desulfovibrio intestinalis]|uniref:DNA-binding transcriptional LysR family regulator n=1 Tax=Desulfovibrio intestinalis TaxID=58621 RepID=A0A7W8C292_9BACT|nr:LysR family transcriptional regulator [Desulfovibrio intestinalis]MBB5143097.1 DNA-binding transcriptional LysR family regulator [Desulfovibrio intestinalis]
MLPDVSTLSQSRAITLEHLRAFTVVAHCRSFQKAGVKLCRSQSAVTQAVKRLEAQLNCTLLYRSHGHVAGLTPEGERILPEIVDVLLRLEHVIQAGRRPELKGRIQVGIPPSFSAVELQGAVARLLALNPGLQIGIISDMSSDLEQMLAEGSLDVALINQYRFDDGTLPQGMFQELCRQPLLWLCNAQKVVNHAGEIPLLTYSAGSPWRTAAVDALDQAGLAYNFAYVSASYESLCSSLLAGFGVTVLPGWDIDERFCIVDGSYGLPTLPVVRTVLKSRSQSTVVQQFCDFIAGLPFFVRAREHSP